MTYYAFLSALLLALSGCIQKAPLKLPQNSQQHIVYTQDFNILTLHKNKDQTAKQTDTLRIYLEGDGRAWRNRYSPSTNPTPTQSVIVDMFSMDTSDYKAYIARPCQFTPSDKCHKTYWTGARYSEEIIKSLDTAVDQIKQKMDAKSIQLIGHSGGGTVALLLAARRDDITSIITLAGNLNHADFTTTHKLTPMKASLNPANHIKQTKHIPQIHFAGGQDNVIPPALVKNYTQQANNSCVNMETLPQVSHHEGWLQHTTYILNKKPSCKK